MHLPPDFPHHRSFPWFALTLSLAGASLVLWCIYMYLYRNVEPGAPLPKAPHRKQRCSNSSDSSNADSSSSNSSNADSSSSNSSNASSSNSTKTGNTTSIKINTQQAVITPSLNILDILDLSYSNLSSPHIRGMLDSPTKKLAAPLCCEERVDLSSSKGSSLEHDNFVTII